MSAQPDGSVPGARNTNTEGSTITLPPLPLSASNSTPSSSQATRSRFGVESAMGLLVESLQDRLLFAVPKKGRLSEKCLELLQGASHV
jgi:ATP phosphoribosyltransferase